LPIERSAGSPSAHKATPGPIGLDDISEFLATEADFAFEMRVLRKLRGLNCNCEHAGTYADPITQKRRQFDVRAKLVQLTYDLRLAVECKNLRDTSPLLVHAVKRTQDEAFHDLVIRRARSQSRIVRVESYESTYEPDQFAGKGSDQVTRKADGTFGRSDADVFDKITQAVNSARDLIDEAVNVPSSVDSVISIIPMLVVPDGRLWQVNYSPDGAQLGPPQQVHYCPFFLNHPWVVAGTNVSPPYTLSHLEMMTFSGMGDRVASHLYGHPGFRSVFALRHAAFSRPPLGGFSHAE